MSGDAHRPLWSVMIPAYNAGRTLPETLASVLRQDPGPSAMQIEVIDDCSPEEDLRPLVERAGHGRVGYARQPRNLGVGGNLTDCIRRARGRLVHLLHADDLVERRFYSRMQAAFEVEPAIGAAFCRHRFIDGDGQVLSTAPLERPSSGLLENAAERLALEQRIMTPAMVVRRSVYETLGGFDQRLACAEDWEMWVRIAAHYPIWYEAEPLASYRMHAASNTGRHLRSGDDIRYTGLAIALFAGHLPPEAAGRIVPRARATYARAALGSAKALLRRGDLTGAAAQTREALRLVRSGPALAAAARMAAGRGISALRNRLGLSERSH